MKTISINVERRSELGKKSTRDLRKMDHVPCVMYGGAEVIHFQAHENEFKNLVYSHIGYIVEVKLDGKVHKAVMHDLQFHSVTDKLYHIDFVEVFDDRPITVELPLNLVGIPIGIKNGGRARQRRRVLKVRGLMEHLPDALDLDVTNVEIGDVIKIGDLSYKNLEILDPARSMIYSVVSSRVSMKGMMLEEPEAEGEEGEEVAEGEEAPAEAGAEEETGAES
jgi:large subunit ribosomal protein L25